jgi:hypothetical protein
LVTNSFKTLIRGIAETSAAAKRQDNIKIVQNRRLIMNKTSNRLVEKFLLSRWDLKAARRAARK